MLCSPKVAVFFKEQLSEPDWHALEGLLEEYQLFVYYQDDERFELEEGLINTGLLDEPGVFDLLLECCQLLNDRAPKKVKVELLQALRGEEEFTFYYTFPADSDGANENIPEAASNLVVLLKKNPGFRYYIEELAWEVRVVVTITFRSELEFQRKKDTLEWLVQVAGRKTNHKPFGGRIMG